MLWLLVVGVLSAGCGQAQGESDSSSEMCVTDAESSSSVQIEIRNDSQATIWVQGYIPLNDPVGYRPEPVTITSSGASESLVTRPNDCDTACFDEPPTLDCGRECSSVGPLRPGVIVIEPGGTYTSEWDGRHVVAKQMPGTCPGCAEDETVTCGVFELAPDGAYEVAAIVSTDFSCAEDDCMCTPNADGWCQSGFFSYIPFESPTVLTTDLTWPGATKVTLVYSG